MNSVNIQINGQDNLSPLLNNLTQQVYKLRSATQNISVGGGGMGGGGRGLTGQIAAGMALGNVYMRLADLAYDFGKESVRAFMDLEKARRIFSFGMGETAGKMADFAGEIERLRIGNFAKEFGLVATDVQLDFAKFLAATKETNISLTEAESIFKGVTKASATFGLESQQTQRIFKALIDIVSKGKLQSQELVQQLGNNLPGAVQLFARSLGISSAKLRELMKEGKITSEELVKFGNYLDAIYDKSAKGNLNTLQGQLNELKNSFEELAQVMGTALGPGLMKAIEFLKFVVEGAKNFLESVFGATIKSRVSSELAETWDQTEEGKKMKELAKNPKKMKQYVEDYGETTSQKLRDFGKFLSINENYDQIAGFFGTETREAFQNLDELMREGASKEDIAAQQGLAGELAAKDLSTAFTIEKETGSLNYKNLPFEIAKQWKEKFNLLIGAKKDTFKEGEVPFLSEITDIVTQMAKNEMLKKLSGYGGDGGGDEPPPEEKLKTDYHTPKIININILTGEGASMIAGGVTTTIETQKVGALDIKNNINYVLNEHLDMVLNDTASAVLRVAKSSGMA